MRWFVLKENETSEMKSFLFSIAVGNWSAWGNWSACSVSCGVGFQYQTRQCLGAGFGCVGEAINTMSCNTSIACPGKTYCVLIRHSSFELKSILSSGWKLDCLVGLVFMSGNMWYSNSISYVIIETMNNDLK